MTLSNWRLSLNLDPVLCESPRYIFYRIPKCASTTTYKFLKSKTLAARHKYEKTLHNEIKSRMGIREWGQAFKFAFVRNPYRRIYSAYRYFCEFSRVNSWRDCIPTFEEFVLNLKYLQRVRSDIYSHTLPQTIYICNPLNNAYIVNYIGRLEHYNEGMKHICRVLNIPYEEIPVSNDTGTEGWNSMYSSRMKKEVVRMYEEDFIKLSYPI